jgi:hypothetical protein
MSTRGVAGDVLVGKKVKGGAAHLLLLLRPLGLR